MAAAAPLYAEGGPGCGPYKAFLELVGDEGLLAALRPDALGLLRVAVPFCGTCSEADLVSAFAREKLLTLPGVRSVHILGVDVEPQPVWWECWLRRADRCAGTAGSPQVRLQFCCRDLAVPQVDAAEPRCTWPEGELVRAPDCAAALSLAVHPRPLAHGTEAWRRRRRWAPLAGAGGRRRAAVAGADCGAAPLVRGLLLSPNLRWASAPTASHPLRTPTSRCMGGLPAATLNSARLAAATSASSLWPGQAVPDGSMCPAQQQMRRFGSHPRPSSPPCVLPDVRRGPRRWASASVQTGSPACRCRCCSAAAKAAAAGRSSRPAPGAHGTASLPLRVPHGGSPAACSC